MSDPKPYQLQLLREARHHLKDKDIAPYLRLKRLLAEKPVNYEVEFRRVFASYYGLNVAGLSPAFKDRYFERLFGLRLRPGVDPYTPLLRELHEIPGLNGKQGLHCSFVSKLVSIHDETRPIFDHHIGNFFGLAVPADGSVDFRIAGFLWNLERLSKIYERWSHNPDVQEIVAAVVREHPGLAACAFPRIADQLVWTVGSYKLAESPATKRTP